MMNFKTILLITTVLAVSACSDSSDQADTKKEPMAEPMAETKAETKTKNKDHLLKGYQDNLQKAKDMGEEVKKAAEKQKKAIADATN